MFTPCTVHCTCTDKRLPHHRNEWILHTCISHRSTKYACTCTCICTHVLHSRAYLLPCTWAPLGPVTWAASGPLAPWMMMNSTVSPSPTLRRNLRGLFLMMAVCKHVQMYMYMHIVQWLILAIFSRKDGQYIHVALVYYMQVQCTCTSNVYTCSVFPVWLTTTTSRVMSCWHKSWHTHMGIYTY